MSIHGIWRNLKCEKNYFSVIVKYENTVSELLFISHFLEISENLDVTEYGIVKSIIINHCFSNFQISTKPPNIFYYI